MNTHVVINKKTGDTVEFNAEKYPKFIQHFDQYLKDKGCSNLHFWCSDVHSHLSVDQHQKVVGQQMETPSTLRSPWN